VDTEHGVVHLQGSVPTERDRMEAERLARVTKGVVDVKNDLKQQMAAAVADVPDAPAGAEAIPPSVSAPSATVVAIDATIDLDLFMRFPLVGSRPIRLPDWPVAHRRIADPPLVRGGVADILRILRRLVDRLSLHGASKRLTWEGVTSVAGGAIG